MSDEARKITIYVSPALARVMRASGDASRSGRLTDMALRYEAIIEEELSKFAECLTLGDWCAIMDSNNGAFLNDEHTWRSTYLNVIDCDEDLDAKWGIDRRKLAAGMRYMRLAQRAAIAEAIERFWSDDVPGTNAERLQRAGVSYFGMPTPDAAKPALAPDEEPQA